MWLLEAPGITTVQLSRRNPTLSMTRMFRSGAITSWRAGSLTRTTLLMK